MKSLPRYRNLPVLLAAGICLAVLAAAGHASDIDRDLFGEPEHKVVYQFNSADPEYMRSVLFSVGAMLRKHGDNIHLVVTAIGPGIHIVATCLTAEGPCAGVTKTFNHR